MTFQSLVLGLSLISAFGLVAPANAAELATCHATKIIDDWILEDALDTAENSTIRLATAQNGFRFFVGKATYENWEYCNIEPMPDVGDGSLFHYRVDDYKQDLTLYLQAAIGRGGTTTGMITAQLNPAKPATPVAEFVCE